MVTSTKPVKLGIIGPGNIAQRFACAAKMVAGIELSAVYARNEQKGKDFCKKFNIPSLYTEVENFLNSDVNLVYISTPHSHHSMFIRDCLLHQKNIICEKPFTANSGQAEALFSLAKEQHCFVMEAMWTRFLPVMQDVKKWLSDSRIGSIRRITADFSGLAKFPPEHRLYNPHLAGGALLDIGIYCVAFACSVLGGHPQKITSDAFLGKTGVDEQFSAVLQYDEGAMAVLTGAINMDGSCEAVIYGTLGKIVIPQFFGAEKATLYFGNEVAEVSEHPYENGFQYEIKGALQSCLNGAEENIIIPWQDTIDALKICDTLRKQWKLQYPFERET